MDKLFCYESVLAMCIDRDALINKRFVFVKLMQFKNSLSFIGIVLLKLRNIFHKISYLLEYSTSNDMGYQALGPLFS